MGGGGSRGGYGGGGGGGFGGNDSEIIVQQDTIFVGGMDPSVTMDEISEFFGVLGIIKVRFCFSFKFAYFAKQLPFSLCRRTVARTCPRSGCTRTRRPAMARARPRSPMTTRMQQSLRSSGSMERTSRGTTSRSLWPSAPIVVPWTLVDVAEAGAGLVVGIVAVDRRGEVVAAEWAEIWAVEGVAIEEICRNEKAIGSAVRAATRTLRGATSAIAARNRKQEVEGEEEEAAAEVTAGVEVEEAVTEEVDVAVAVVEDETLDQCEEGELGSFTEF